MKRKSRKRKSMKRKSIWLRVGIVCPEHTGGETNKAEDETGAAKGDGALSENTKGTSMSEAISECVDKCNTTRSA
jgi:hypothetical protein